MLREERARMAAAIYADRRDRDLLFAGYGDGLGEPAWDMLLMLYMRDAVGLPVTAGDLVAATGRPAELAWPFLGWLKSQNLIALAGIGREADDAVTLQDEGRALMDAYLDRRGGEGRGRTH